MVSEVHSGRRRSRRKRVGLAGAGAAGLVVGDVAVVVGGIVRAATRYPRPVDDGPDPLLVNPGHLMRSTVVPTAEGSLLHAEVSLDLEDHPSDVVLVFVHGWTCSTRVWNPQVNRFAGEHPVIAYDHRGHGLSEMGRARVTVDTLGQDLEAVLTHLLPRGKRAVLVGHSVGGTAIMSWAKQFAGVDERIAAVVLASTTPRDVVQEQALTPASRPRFTDPVMPLVGRAFVSTPLPLPSNGMTSRLTHYLALGPEARAAHVDFTDEMISRGSAKSRAAWGSAIYRLNVVAGLEALSVPTAVVVGDRDLLTPPKHSDFMAEVLDRNGVLLEYLTYAGAGHMVPIERASSFNTLIDDILASV
ncbi:MAG: alpha/beta fold hydrolase [Gordonia sp. (in: high G+C Gram-positive bacteria)]|uniref:alpha/beta fold hydrolase n=1 Tax=Gordonia sp. (in: high G+C Gram-positive bacteria) TaxID=84139 RepID=UPI0039E5AE44